MLLTRNNTYFVLKRRRNRVPQKRECQFWGCYATIVTTELDWLRRGRIVSFVLGPSIICPINPIYFQIECKIIEDIKVRKIS